MTDDVQLLESARQAFAAHDWTAAYEKFVAVSDRDALQASDMHAWAQSAWWLGKIEVCLDAFEGAYHRFLDADEPLPAAMSAFYLALHSRLTGGHQPARH